MRKFFYCLIIWFFFLFLFPGSSLAMEKPLIAIQPLGKISEKIIESVTAGIKKAYSVDTVVLPVKKLPESAWYKPRKRYRAEKILDYLNVIADEKHTKIVGLTAKDISTTKGDIYDWGIFGLGSLGGKPCVISTFRLRRGKVSYNFFINRVIKVVNHEIGHTFGLPHCLNYGCLMEDAKGTIKTVDRETGIFCDECRKQLKDLLN